MTDFTIDDRLLQDCSLLLASHQCSYLLHRNASVDWFILVPHCNETEFYQLPDMLQQHMLGEVNRVSRFLKSHLQADKINVATLGNVVAQMHIHVIGRYHDDPYWPDPVWGQPVTDVHEPSEVEAMRMRFTRYVNEDNRVE